MMQTGRGERSLSLSLTSGCISGAVSTLLFQPLDVLKTRLQAEILTGHSNPGLIHLFKSILRGHVTPTQTVPLYKGLANFWMGTVPALWRCVPGVGGYFMCLSLLEKSTSRYKSDWIGSTGCMAVLYSFLTGFTSRSMVAVVLDPFLVLKTQAESGRYTDPSMWSAICRIRNQTGWRGFYSGVVATIARDGPYSGLYYVAYSAFKPLFAFVYPNDIDPSVHSVLTVASCACLASFVATGLTQPADVLRVQRQLMLTPAQLTAVSGTSPRRAKSSWRTVFLSVYRTDGVRGLWRGFLFRLLRRTGMSVISWTLYEHLT